jgi:hypothetical protein
MSEIPPLTSNNKQQKLYKKIDLLAIIEFWYSLKERKKERTMTRLKSSFWLEKKNVK